jgi:hypothetical protein
MFGRALAGRRHARLPAQVAPDIGQLWKGK